MFDILMSLLRKQKITDNWNNLIKIICCHVPKMQPRLRIPAQDPLYSNILPPSYFWGNRTRMLQCAMLQECSIRIISAQKW